MLALGRQPVANLAQVIGAERLVGMGDQCSRIVRSILPSRILLSNSQSVGTRQQIGLVRLPPPGTRRVLRAGRRWPSVLVTAGGACRGSRRARLAAAGRMLHGDKQD